jgi:hypothetical protein
MADSTAGWAAPWPGGLERSWGSAGGGTAPGREMEASLKRCSVKEELWCGSRVRNGRLGTSGIGNEVGIRFLALYAASVSC